MIRSRSGQAADQVLLAVFGAVLISAVVSPVGARAEAWSGAGAAQGPSIEDPLRDGNRLFRAGDLEAAVVAYRRGAEDLSAGDRAGRVNGVSSISGDQAADLITYNLATTLHHLGRLPEAVLWYRRAGRHLDKDPWLLENLARARLELGVPTFASPATLGALVRRPWLVPTIAGALAWVGLALALRRSRRRWALLGLGLSAAIWISTFAVRAFGPLPAVVLEDCSESVPAGSEVWVRPDGGTWRLIGDDPSRCATEILGFVDR